MTTLIVADIMLFVVFIYSLIDGGSIAIDYDYNRAKYQDKYNTNRAWKYVSGSLFVTLYITTQI